MDKNTMRAVCTNCGLTAAHDQGLTIPPEKLDEATPRVFCETCVAHFDNNGRLPLRARPKIHTASTSKASTQSETCPPTPLIEGEQYLHFKGPYLCVNGSPVIRLSRPLNVDNHTANTIMMELLTVLLKKQVEMADEMRDLRGAVEELKDMMKWRPGGQEAVATQKHFEDLSSGTTKKTNY